MTYADLDGWFNYEDLYSYVVDVVPDGARVVEVGCWMGKSLAYLAQRVKSSGKDIKVFGVETGFGSPEEEVHRPAVLRHGGNFAGKLVSNLNACGVLDVCYPLIVPSVQAAKLFEDESLDFVFIDGDHSESAVRADLEAWYPKIKPGGIFAGHDYNDWMSVTAAVDAFFGCKVPSNINRWCWMVRKPTQQTQQRTSMEQDQLARSFETLQPRGPYVPEIVVGIQAYDRPDLTWRTLRSLQLAAERAPWLKLRTVGFIDRRPDNSVNPIVLGMFENPWPGTLPIEKVIVPDRNLDANDGCRVLTEACFNLGEFVIHSEDDLLYSHDYFDYMACGFERYRNDAAVLSLISMSVFGNDRTYHDVAPLLYKTLVIPQATQLYGVGWFPRTWEKFQKVWTPSGPLSLDVGLERALSPSDLCGICPFVSRCRHIGFYQGRYGPWRNHSEEQFAGYEKLNYIRWDADCFHPKSVTDYPWNWVQPTERQGEPCPLPPPPPYSPSVGSASLP